MTGPAYAGDLLPADAWQVLERDPKAILIDVRTQPEWEYVGVPNLEQLGRHAIFVEWQTYPDKSLNPDFVDDVRRAGVPADGPVLLLCRSGVRSLHAAIALTQAGFGSCFNVADGFEGQLDPEQHRGAEGSGWKAAGLPWSQ